MAEFTESINLATFGQTADYHSGLISTFGYLFFLGRDSFRIDDLADRTEALLIEQFQYAIGE